MPRRNARQLARKVTRELLHERHLTRRARGVDALTLTGRLERPRLGGVAQPGCNMIGYDTVTMPPSGFGKLSP